MTGTLTSSDLEKVAKMLADRFGIRVICGGAECKVVGDTIFLPTLPKVIENERLLTLIRYFLDHECGHLVGKTNMKLIGELEKSKGKAYALILDVLEDVRCDQIMSEFWAGCEVNLRLGSKELFERMEKSDDETKAHPVKQSLLAIYAKGKGLDYPTWVEQPIRDLAEKYGSEIETIPSWASKTSELVPLADRIMDDLNKMMDPNQQQQMAGDGEEGDGDGQSGQGTGQGSGKGGKSGGSGQSRSRQQGNSGTGSQSGGGDSGDADDADEQAESGGSGQDGDSDDADSSEGDGDGDGDSGALGESSDQHGTSCGGGKQHSLGNTGNLGAAPVPDQLAGTDYEQLKFNAGKECGEAVDEELRAMLQDNRGKMWRPARPELDVVIDFDEAVLDSKIRRACSYQSMSTGTFVDDFIQYGTDAGGPLRQRLAQLLQSEARTWWRGGQTRGTPDPRQLAALATGTNDRVMRKRKVHTAPNTACYMLVDGSGSMAGDEMYNAMLAATSFVQVLDLCGHASAVGVFQSIGCVDADLLKELGMDVDGEVYDKETGDYRDVAREYNLRTYSVELMRIKKWGESFHQVKRKLAAAAGLGGGGTPMGDAIIMAAKELLERPEPRKVMMVFTDGYPDSVEVTQEACKLCERGGIETVCIGIDSNYVQNLHHRHANITDIKSMGGATMDELTKALQAHGL